MKVVSPFSCLSLALLLVRLLPVNGQMNVPCSASMLSSFTPCMNFVTNSSVNGTSPTVDCCNAIRSLASGGRDCLCFIITGLAPFQIPINRTLAISLPRACNLTGVPLQCNGAIAPVPAPGPISPGPSFAPKASPSSSPEEPKTTTPAAETPSSSPVVPDAESPTSTAGSRPVLTPSSALPSNTIPPFLLLGFTLAIFKF